MEFLIRVEIILLTGNRILVNIYNVFDLWSYYVLLSANISKFIL